MPLCDSTYLPRHTITVCIPLGNKWFYFRTVCPKCG
jgi:hypothetical protein